MIDSSQVDHISDLVYSSLVHIGAWGRSKRIFSRTDMTPSINNSAARKTDRLEAFNDAVLAIAITLPLVELHVPQVGENGNLLAELTKLWPSYVAYVLSFLVIGTYWARSHFLGKILVKTDHAYNLLNLLFLASVSVLPFPTRAFANHVGGDSNSKTAAVFYAFVLVAPALIWTVKWFYSVKQALLDPRFTVSYVSRVMKVCMATTAALILSASIAFFEWHVGIALALLITFAYLLPPRSPEYKPGQEPADELEEAEDAPRD